MKYLTLAWIQCSHLFHRLLKEEKGASAIEYVLIAAVVVIAVAAIDLDGVYSAAVSKLNATISAATIE